MPTLPKDWPAVLVVHLATIVCCGAAGWYVFSKGSNLPVMDEWDLLSEWVSADSTAGWVIGHHNEHRYPLGRAVWLGALRATGYNFRAPMYVTLALLTAAAVLFQWTARGVRGRAHPIDALFPVLLLHFGHGFAFVMGYQCGFALAAYAIAGWVWTAGRLAAGGGSGWAALSGVYAVVLAQCGGFGLAFTPPLVLWLVYLGVRAGRSRVWVSAGGLAATAVALLAYAGWVYVTMPKFMSQGTDPRAEPGAFAAAAAEYLGIGLGVWPVNEGRAVGAVVVVAVAVWYAAAAVRVGWWVKADDGRRAVGVAVLMVILGCGAVGAAAALARGGAMTDRYVTPSAAGLCAVLLATTAWRPGRAVPAAFTTALVLAVGGAVYWVNLIPGLRHAYYIRLSLSELRRDMDAGVPPSFLAGKHGGTLGVVVGDRLADCIRTLRRGGVPQFQSAADDPAVIAVPVVGLALPYTLTCEQAQLGPDGSPPVVHLPPPPAGAIGLRCRATVVRSAGWQKLTLHWTDAATGTPHRAHVYPPWLVDAMSLVFPLSSTPTDVRLIPDSMFDLTRIESAEWLLPADSR
jgi:hypothetical protein